MRDAAFFSPAHRATRRRGAGEIRMRARGPWPFRKACVIAGGALAPIGRGGPCGRWESVRRPRGTEGKGGALPVPCEIGRGLSAAAERNRVGVRAGIVRFRCCARTVLGWAALPARAKFGFAISVRFGAACHG
jgi:hypothetical protein